MKLSNEAKMPRSLLLIVGRCDDYEDHREWHVGAVDATDPNAIILAEKWVRAANAKSVEMAKNGVRRQSGLIELARLIGDEQLVANGFSMRWWPKWALVPVMVGVPVGSPDRKKGKH